jgi:hypothetical protein
MTHQVQFADYFGSILDPPGSILAQPFKRWSGNNDIWGIILSFVDPSAVIKIIKINQLLNTLSNEEFFYLIKTDFNIRRDPYETFINYRDSKVSYFVLQQILWILTYMPLLYVTDNRKTTLVKQIGSTEYEKHYIETIHHYGFNTMDTINQIKLPNKQHLLLSKYLKTRLKHGYISRSATLLSFMIYGFERLATRESYSFRCKQVKLTKSIILQYAHLFKDWKYVDGHLLIEM